jgi:hypothetical protein
VTPLFALLNDPLSIIPSVLYDVVDFHVRIRIYSPPAAL